VFRVEHLYDQGFVSDINFNVRKGEILGFAGLAGAGRTELMEALCGFTKKIAGDVFLNGEQINITNYKTALNHGIAYISEDRGKYGLIVDLDIGKNITLPQLKNFSKALGYIDKKQEDEVGEKYIHDVGIKAPDAAFLVTNLSGGNQQKVSVSKALALEPQLMILDEPTRGVDVNAKAEIHKIISELTAHGLTIIMISSELPELVGMCDRIYVMKEGSIAGCFDRADVSQEKILKLALDSGVRQEGDVAV
jgi:ABC-type sugar transport system ATPase subunit